MKTKRKKLSSLAIVEKGYRGAIEEQYGNIVWLSECMKGMGAHHNLLLCGGAVACCFTQQQQQKVTIGDLEITTISHFKQSVIDLIAKGSRIWVVRKDLALFGEDHTLVTGVEVTDSIAALCLEHDKVWFW